MPRSEIRCQNYYFVSNTLLPHYLSNKRLARQGWGMYAAHIPRVFSKVLAQRLFDNRPPSGFIGLAQKLRVAQKGCGVFVQDGFLHKKSAKS
jgi:hypothetical protein